MGDTGELTWLSLKDAEKSVASRSTIYRRIGTDEYQSEKRSGRLWVGVPPSHVTHATDEATGTVGTDGMCQSSHDTVGTSQETREALRLELERVCAERDGASAEVDVLQVKLTSSEQAHEASRRESETLRDDVEHLRKLTIQQAETLQSLTEEMKGLTASLHWQQTNPQLETRVVEKRASKPGLLRRWFGRKPKVRIGHA